MPKDTISSSFVDMNNLEMSNEVKPLFDKVVKHIKENVDPISDEFYKLAEENENRWHLNERQLELLEGAETLNCSAPDTGNMEVLERVGTPEQKEKWLKPLLNGEIRSCYGMTEPAVASSDAKNISTSAELVGNEWVINGEKYYISGAGDSRCKIMICMVKTNPDAEPFRQQSQILIPLDTPGLEIVQPMTVFGQDEAPKGHMHIRMTNVKVPKENVLWGEGKGFEISQVRLGPGRIHHCMRSIGQAEKALDLLINRGLSRKAFGKNIVNLGKNMETFSDHVLKLKQ